MTADAADGEYPQPAGYSGPALCVSESTGHDRRYRALIRTANGPSGWFPGSCASAEGNSEDYGVRTKFAAELAALSEELGRLAELASLASERAAVGLARADLTAAYEALAADEELQAGYTACENRAVILLALEAPVARDLRQVVSAIRITDDLSRIGSLISAIAETAVRYFPDPLAPPEVADQLAAIGEATAGLIAATNAAIAASPGKGDVLVPPDPELAELRAEVLARVSEPEWPHGHAVAMDLALLIHRYERCAEHCVRIGGLINFFHTGRPLSLEAAE